MSRVSSLLLLVLFLSPLAVNSYRILGVFPHPGLSHFFFFEAVLKSLSEAGHELVVISPFPNKNPPANYTDYSLGNSNTLVNSVNLEWFENRGILTHPTEFFLLYQWGIEACETLLTSKALQHVLNDKRGFDLLITEQFNTDCSMAIAWKLKIPTISMSSCALMPWHYDRFGLPPTPSHIPILFSKFNEDMDFGQRIYNFVFGNVMKFFYSQFSNRAANNLIKQHLGDGYPDVDELAKTTSLVFVNQHYSLSGAKPLSTSVIELGGIHIDKLKPNKLDDELINILNNSEHGVIYVSWGSMIRSESLPTEKRDALLKAFGSLKQTVLWKWENDTLPNKPSNVVVRKWMPQKEIICHPKVRVFMTHSGLLGSSEAAYCGVPIVMTPMYGDQFLNAAALAYRRMGVILHYEDVNKKDVIIDALNVALTNEYRENARKVSLSYRNRLNTPAETAVWWVEHIIRTGGETLNRSKAIGMPWYIYWSCDVISVIAITLLVILGSWIWVIRYLFCRKSKAQKNPVKSKTQ